MRPFTTLTAVAAPLDLANVDTDRIIPGRFLRKPRTAEGLGGCLFHDLRFAPDGTPNEDFIPARPAYRGARILVADENFGCGSSRESAVWALVDAHGPINNGFHAIIAPSFGDIFYNNACNNGLLPVRLPAATCAALRRQLHDRPGAEISIDLAAQLVRGPDGGEHRFEIDPHRKMRLLEGLDDIALTLREADAIAAHEARARREQPWRQPFTGGQP